MTVAMVPAFGLSACSTVVLATSAPASRLRPEGLVEAREAWREIELGRALRDLLELCPRLGG